MAGFLLTDRARSRQRWFIFLALCSVVAILISASARYRNINAGEVLFPDLHSPSGFNKELHLSHFVKPDGIKIVALIFFGRRSRVEILRCYLERNLVDNGGWLDEVHWVQNTDKEDDLKYLDEILATSPRYQKIDLTGEGVGYVGYGFAWGHLERGSLYVKIDDDVVYAADDAIPRIISLKLAHPEYLVVSANVINSPLMGWVHYHSGAMHPYLPEFNVWELPSTTTGPKGIPVPKFTSEPPHQKSWLYLSYPNWSGPEDWYFELDQDPPYEGHRWLRLSNDSEIHRTPVAEIEYKTWGTGLKSWAIAAQEHYSFLENLATNNLDIYRLDHAWITDYERLSINFIAIWANDVLDNLPMDTVDEEWLTINLPRKLGKSVAVETQALVVHFTFGTQGDVEKTDLLPRYLDYAKENACARRVSSNLRAPEKAKDDDGAG